MLKYSEVHLHPESSPWNIFIELALDTLQKEHLLNRIPQNLFIMIFSILPIEIATFLSRKLLGGSSHLYTKWVRSR